MTPGTLQNRRCHLLCVQRILLHVFMRRVTIIEHAVCQIKTTSTHQISLDGECGTNWNFPSSIFLKISTAKAATLWNHKVISIPSQSLFNLGCALSSNWLDFPSTECFCLPHKVNRKKYIKTETPFVLYMQKSILKKILQALHLPKCTGFVKGIFY